MRILCAEDDLVFQTMLKKVLGMWGYEVQIASDGNQALAYLLNGDGPRLAILDWTMPGLEGVEVCRRIRASRQSYYTYIILLTAHDRDDEFLAGMESGADDYLTKPFNLSELQSRLRVAKRILDSEERVRVLFDEAPVAYHEIDADGIIVRVNHAECALLGYRAQEMVGRPVWEFVIPENREESRLAVQRKMKGVGESLLFERDYVRQDGVVLTLQIHENPIRNEQGCIIGMRSALLDITEKREHERELARHAAELARSNAELEQFAYVASHDLQEPLRMITSYTQLLARRYSGKLDADADEFIRFAVDGAQRMQGLINDLLAYSRVNRRAGELVLTDSEMILNRALDNLKMAITESDAEIDWEPLPSVMADPLQLTQLFQNLVGNAVKFRKAGIRPRIDIRVIEREWECEFSVRDNGIGIDPKYFERVFQVFQRLHTRADYAGTGIGLAICRKIVERHGGRVWIESQPGQGADFRFTISNGGVS